MIIQNAFGSIGNPWAIFTEGKSEINILNCDVSLLKSEPIDLERGIFDKQNNVIEF